MKKIYPLVGMLFCFAPFTFSQTPVLSLQIPHRSGIKHFEFSSDSKLLLTVGKYDNTVKVWDINSGKVLANITGEKLNTIDFRNTKQLFRDFIPDIDAKFAGGTNDVVYYLSGRSTVGVWEAATGNVRQIHFPDSCRILSLSMVAETGNKPGICVSSIGSGNLILSDYAGKTFRTIRVSKQPLAFTFLNKSGTYIATEGVDTTISVISTSSWQTVFEKKSAKLVIADVSPDNDLLILKEMNKTGMYSIWSLTNKKKLFESQQSVAAVLSKDEKFIYDIQKDSLLITDWQKGIKTGKKLSEIYPKLRSINNNPYLIATILNTYNSLPANIKIDTVFSLIQNISYTGADSKYKGVGDITISKDARYFGYVSSQGLHVYNMADWSMLPLISNTPFYDDIKAWNYSNGVVQVLTSGNLMFSWDIKQNKRNDIVYRYGNPNSLSPLAQSPAESYRSRQVRDALDYATDSSGRYDIYLVNEETIVIADYKTKRVYASLQLSGRTQLIKFLDKESVLIFTSSDKISGKSKVGLLNVTSFINQYESLDVTFGWVYEDQVKGYKKNGDYSYLTVDMISGFLNFYSVPNPQLKTNYVFSKNYSYFIVNNEDRSSLSFSKIADGQVSYYMDIPTDHRVLSFTTSFDDKLLVYSVSQYEGPAIWDIATQKETARLQLPQGTYGFFLNSEIYDLAFSFDKKYVVGTLLQESGEKETILIWSAATGRLLKMITDTDMDFAYSLNSTNNNLVYTLANGATIMYNLDDDSSKALFYNTRQLSQLVQFSDDSKYLISYYDGMNTIFGNANTFTPKLVINGTDFRFIDHNNIVSHEGAFFNVYNIDTGLRYRFILLDTSSSVCFTSQNYYSLPRTAVHNCYYVSGNKILDFQQLDAQYNRPDKVLEAMGYSDTALIHSYKRAYEKRIQRLHIDTSEFGNDFMAPEADIINRNTIAYQQDNNKLSLHIKGKSSTVLDRFNVWVNNVPVYGVGGIGIKADKRLALDTTVTITLSQDNNKIETSVTNANGIESYRTPLYVNYKPAQTESETTYFIGIGIDKFAEPGYDLRWSSKDISDLAASLANKIKSIRTYTLLNGNVTLENIRALKSILLQTTVNDKVIIAYSGHGLLNDKLDYYLSTYNINFALPEQNGLPYEELEKLLDSIPARKKLILIDACHSGEVDKENSQELAAVNERLTAKGIIRGAITESRNNYKLGIKNSFGLMQELFVNVGKSTGATIMSAAAGSQFALEKGSLQNGVFTYSILEYMQKHEHTALSALKLYVNRRVPELTEGMQAPTARNETIDTDWNVW